MAGLMGLRSPSPGIADDADDLQPAIAAGHGQAVRRLILHIGEAHC